MNALYINDINQDIVKSNYIQNTNVNWVWKNVKIKKIDKHKNVVCQMQSLEKTLTL
jgi:hypothetical protein